MSSAASVAALRKAKSNWRVQGSSNLIPLSEKRIEGNYELDMLMLDGWVMRIRGGQLFPIIVLQNLAGTPSYVDSRYAPIFSIERIENGRLHTYAWNIVCCRNARINAKRLTGCSRDFLWWKEGHRPSSSNVPNEKVSQRPGEHSANKNDSGRIQQVFLLSELLYCLCLTLRFQQWENLLYPCENRNHLS